MLETVSHDAQSANAESATARAKTDEFTAAVNRIEARRARESAQANGTVDIEQTIRELHIDASSDEVIREIAVMRAEAAEKERLAQAAAAEQLATHRMRRKRISWRFAGCFGLVLLGSFIQYGTDHHNDWSVDSTESSAHPVSSADPESSDHTVAALGNGQEMFRTSTALQSLISAGGTISSPQAAKIMGSTSIDDDHSWPVIRVGKSLSLYGYVDTATVGTPSPSKEVHDEESDERTLVAIPLAGVNIVSGEDDEITLANLPSTLTATPGKSLPASS